VRFREGRREHAFEGGLALVARRVVGGILDLQAGQTLLILSGPFSHELVDALLVAAEARGAVAIQHNWSRTYILGRLDAHSKEAVAKADFLPKALMDSVDAVCQIAVSIPQGAPPNEEQRDKLPGLLAAVSRWQDSLAREGVGFVEVSLPSRSDFQSLVTPEVGMDTYWRAIAQDPVAVERRVAALEASINSSREVLLVDREGNELRFLLAEEGPKAESEGAPNRSLPTGAWTRRIEVLSGSGRLVADYTAAFGALHEAAAIEFDRGELAALAVGAAGEDLLPKVAEETGDVRSLVSVTVGVSELEPRLTGKSSLDSILGGVVTLGLGTDKHLGGERAATLDLRFTLAECCVFIGGELVVEGGQLLVQAAE
jgi:leucyl aminopeptidase (aminopeptidase T)